MPEHLRLNPDDHHRIVKDFYGYLIAHKASLADCLAIGQILQMLAIHTSTNNPATRTFLYDGLIDIYLNARQEIVKLHNKEKE